MSPDLVSRLSAPKNQSDKHISPTCYDALGRGHRNVGQNCPNSFDRSVDYRLWGGKHQNWSYYVYLVMNDERI
jgi:hypothetical protein